MPLLTKTNQMVGVFFDLEKAYDTTWRGGILKQLASWGIGGHMFSFIEHFLSNRFIKVRVGSELSSPYLQEEGVPQGSVLSVTLFAVAINSLMSHLPPGIQGSLFVDDFAVYCAGSTALQACEKVQIAINAASAWANCRGFKFSPQKTKAVRFTRNRKREKIPTLFLNDSILPYEDEVKFLGVIFDKKLTFSPHINDLSNRVKKSLNILKVVSHFNWGADRTTLLKLYTSLCLSKLDYACQIYGSACRTLLEKLDVVHNMGLRICTGAYRTSPVDSLYVDSGMPPLSIRREELSLRFIARSFTSKNNPNYKYVRDPVDRAPNKPRLPKPLEVRLKDDTRDVGLAANQIAEVDYPKCPPWRNPPVKACITVGGKKALANEDMKTEFLKHAAEHRGIHVFTDGSKSAEGVGCAVIMEEVVIRRKLPSTCSIFTAELQAVVLAIQHIFNSDDHNETYTIFTDSNSVLFSIKQAMPFHHLVQEVQDWLFLLHSRKNIHIHFCWVPAHVGVDGNERADKAAKEASELPNPSPIRIPYSDFKNIIHFHFKNKWQTRWSSLSTNAKLKAIHPSVDKWSICNPSSRRESIILTRMRIGHTHATHSFLMKSGEGRQVPFCNTCQAILSVKHILIECTNFNYQRRVNSLQGRSLSEMLGNQCNIDNLMRFLKSTGFYFKF